MAPLFWREERPDDREPDGADEATAKGTEP